MLYSNGQSNSFIMGIPKESIGSSMWARQKDLDSFGSLKHAVIFQNCPVF